MKKRISVVAEKNLRKEERSVDDDDDDVDDDLCESK